MRTSISKIGLFKACRRAYYFKYIENLEPKEKADALKTGLRYHELIENLHKGELPDTEDFPKESAMAIAYYKYIFPKLKLQDVEQWVEYSLGRDDELIGRVDGVTEDGWLVEHKTTSAELNEEYEFNLQWSEQILAYMLSTGIHKMYYTVCRKPTIRQKQNETEEEFFNRMVAWYDEDTEKKIGIIKVYRTDEELEQFKQELIAMCDEIKHCKHYYCNTGKCNTYGSRCEYSSICLNYDKEQEYANFERRNEKDGN